jgi:hypothetical protein
MAKKEKEYKYNLGDYEPSFTVEFYYSVDIKGNPDVINFIDYLIKQHIKNIEKLNKLIKETKEDK